MYKEFPHLGRVLITWSVDWMPGLCSGIIVSDLGYCAETAIAYEKLKEEQKKEVCEILHDKIVESALFCDTEENAHYLVCSDNHLRSGPSFRELARFIGYDSLTPYKSLVTGHKCQVFGYCIEEDEFEKHKSLYREDEEFLEWDDDIF